MILRFDFFFNDFEILIRKDIQNYNTTQHHEESEPLADDPAASGAFVQALQEEDNNTDSGVKLPGLSSPFCHFPAVHSSRT